VLRAIAGLLNFGCAHNHLSFPQSPRREGPIHQFSRKPTCSVTCLDCGASWEYDWRQMRIGKRIYPKPHQHPEIGPTLDQEA
jgi:hypothetical protein